MATVGEAWVDIKPSARGFGSQLDRDISGEVGAAGKSAGSKFGTAMKVGALAAIGGAIAVGKFLGGAIEEAREAAVIGARTENVIKSMGNAARISAEDVGKLATAISNKTGVDDEAIQSGQNLLLTFGNIKNVVDGEFVGTFNRASYLMTDIAAAMGTDAKGAAIQLGKALNDPIAGMSSLSRVGVSFTAQQKEQIKTLQESGDTVGAQNVILGELQKQFGGAAEAMATPADKLRVTYGNLKEQIGTALLPVADRFLNMLLSAAPTVSAAIAGIGPAFQRVQAFLAPFIAQIQSFFGSGGSGSGLLSGIGSFAQSIGSQLVPLLQTMGQTFTSTILPAVQQFGGYLVANLFPVFQQVAGIIRDQVVPILVAFGQFLYGTLYPALINIVQAVAEKLRPAFDALVEFYRGTLLPALQTLLERFKEYQPTIQKVIEVVVKVAGKIAEFAASIISFVLPKVLALVTFFIQKVIPAIGDVIGVIGDIIGWIKDMGQNFVDGVQKVAKFVSGLKEKFEDAKDYVADIPDKIMSAIGDLGDLLLQAGRDVIQGLIDGLDERWEDAKAWFSRATDMIPDWKGPADRDKVLLKPAGIMIIEGLIDGLQSKLPDVETLLGKVTDLLVAGIVKGEAKTAEAMAKVLDKVVAVAQERVTKLQGVVDSIRSSFDSLASSVAGAFTGDLFSAETGREFLGGLVSTYNNLRAVTDAFGVLRGWGVPSSFLARLFATGNTGLILDLAKDQAAAESAVNILGGIDTAAAGLGASVAEVEFGKELRDANRELREIKQNTRALTTLSRDLAQAINGAVSDGRRKGRAA